MNQFRRPHNYNRKWSGRYIMLLMSCICFLLIFVSLTLNISGGPLKVVSGYIFVPMQNGIVKVGNILGERMSYLQDMDALIAENDALKEQIESLNRDISRMQADQYELDNYKMLVNLKNTYTDFEMVPAQVIAKDSGSWFSIFNINKGENDGITVGMNVLSGGGLCGIVTETGPNYSVVRTIIDNASNVSCMATTSRDTLNVTGNMEQMDTDLSIPFSQLKGDTDMIKVGDPIVTSYISNQYHEGILVGYVKSISLDPNGLTRSGTITPVIDFEHIENVMVVKEIKVTGNEEEDSDEE